jgi:polysaccharide pyruvyl transferase WcaK-like protein
MKQSEKKPPKISFFGHFDSTNFGNEATLQAILYNFRRFQPDAEFACVSTGPQATVATHQIKAIPATNLFLRSWSPQTPLSKAIRKVCIVVSEPYLWIKGLMTLRRTDMFVIPGTGLLTDAMGFRGWGPYDMLKWVLIAKAWRSKVLFVSVGAGPVHSRLGKYLVKMALSLADFRSYRDESTRRYLQGIGFRADNDRIYPDLAFSLSEIAIARKCSKQNGRSVVGLGVMTYAGKYSTSPQIAVHRTYLEILVVFAKWLLDQDNDVRLLIGDLGDIPTVTEFRRLLREGLSEGDDASILDEPVASADELLSQIAETDVVVATRFHNVLLALLCNKPVISISFHDKCTSLMSAMGLQDYCLDINTLKAEALIEKFCDLKTNAEELKPLIRQKASEFREVLEEQYKSIFGDCHREIGLRLGDISDDSEIKAK